MASFDPLGEVNSNSSTVRSGISARSSPRIRLTRVQGVHPRLVNRRTLLNSGLARQSLFHSCNDLVVWPIHIVGPIVLPPNYRASFVDQNESVPGCSSWHHAHVRPQHVVHSAHCKTLIRQDIPVSRPIRSSPIREELYWISCYADYQNVQIPELRVQLVKITHLCQTGLATEPLVEEQQHIRFSSVIRQPKRAPSDVSETEVRSAQPDAQLFRGLLLWSNCHITNNPYCNDYDKSKRNQLYSRRPTQTRIGFVK